ncbi:hypothetical protein DV702_04295 [Sporosarcina sp. PTS2304]|uniref:competence type IV pilus minor pilin ComGF n=1 Tax=Sporosarcina sp. PTS2304 TaxID=2283194 RepID=UPI000E0D1542|nr:competence type IV pilus minor pilin ComGF [Sporosarcina sp. PTS2304]AXH99020.1 hypothetical protein DV702_04295 [Sporosarcina sp. PTS2304]
MKKLNEKGFSLFESMIHLLLFTILIQLTIVFYFWKAPVQVVYQEELLSDWEVFSLEVQEMLEEVSIVEAPTATSVSFYNERGKITLQTYKQMIRKLVNGDGHVPLLVDLASCQFSIDNNQLTIAVKKTDGTTKEGTFAIGLYTK